MKKFIVSLAVAVLLLGLSGVAMATYTITDDATGGDCTQIGTWDAGTKTCTLTSDLTFPPVGYSSAFDVGSNGVTLDGAGHTITGAISQEEPYFSGVGLAGSNITVKNLVVVNFHHGIVVWASNNNLISNNTFQENYLGILLVEAYGNIFSNNIIIGTPNYSSGVRIVDCGDNLFENNNIYNHVYGFSILRGSGILANNTISNNYEGILADDSPSLTIYNNNFVANTYAYYCSGIYGCGSPAVLNNIIPEGGNYWSDYDTPGEGCNDTNVDGFCDMPFYVGGGVDYLPWTMQDGWLDSDNDGFNRTQDCNDSDPAINPSATEIPYNGIDENCNGMADDDDLDNDGYGITDDCNDNDATIYPGAPEVKHDGIDQNCNGYDLTIDITTATYKASTDTLNVEATSALGASANLQLDGYGPMILGKPARTNG